MSNAVLTSARAEPSILSGSRGDDQDVQHGAAGPVAAQRQRQHLARLLADALLLALRGR